MATSTSSSARDRVPAAPGRAPRPRLRLAAGLGLALASLVVIALSSGWPGRVEHVAYSTFEQELASGRLEDVRIAGSAIDARRKGAAAGAPRVAAELVEPALAERLSRFGVTFARVPQAGWLQELLGLVLPWLLMLGGLYWLSRRAAAGASGGLLGIGRSRARLYMERDTGVRFADVAGVDEAKAELQEMVDFLKDPKTHGRLGARVPKGVLLVGPTGTGKTLLARAVAGEAGVAFFSINGSEFIELFVGVGAARVRDLFEQARAQAPAIIFIDELDALGKTRAAAAYGGPDEREQTLNQLLVELDGFDPRIGVVLLAATNRPEILDPALLRAGRFDRQVLVDRPDRAGRLDVLRVHARGVRLAPGTDLAQVAAVTVGFAGADLANLVNEAALVATRRGGDDVTLEDFTLALERLVAGLEKRQRVLGEPERRLVAYHELGHALTSMALPGTDRVHKVSIVPRGVGALGYTLQRPSEDRHVLRRAEMQDRLAVLLGGRAAERLVFGEPSSGAADDLAKATEMAREMVMRLGMDDALGEVSYAGRRAAFIEEAAHVAPAHGALGERTAQAIDDAVQALVQGALARSEALLRANRAALDRCAQALLEHETLDEAQLRALAGVLAGAGAG